MYENVPMARHLTTAQARRDWTKVLRSARRGTPVVVTSNGQPVAAVISIDQLRSLERDRSETLADVIRTVRAKLNGGDLRGPNPWADVRDTSPGRNLDLA
jgi:prevent-host-death family protein